MVTRRIFFYSPRPHENSCGLTSRKPHARITRKMLLQLRPIISRQIVLRLNSSVNRREQQSVVRRTFSKMPAEVITLKFAKLTNEATTPTRGSEQAAGYDLYSAYDYTVPSRGKVLAKTDIQIALPDGCYGRVAPRSGLAAKHFIDVGAGVIDQDYRGNVGVVLFNFGETDFAVKKGDRIAQLICERIYMPELEELKTLDSTDRGEGGFGSTGKN